MFLGSEWLRSNVTVISCTDASPQKRLATLFGADKGGVGAFCVSALPICHTQQAQSSRHLCRRQAALHGGFFGLFGFCGLRFSVSGRVPTRQLNITVPRGTVHPGARPTVGLVQKWADFWQELDEVGDFGRFPVKKRSRCFYFWACWPSARLRAVSHATARRLGPRIAASGIIDGCGHAERHAVARFRSHLAVQSRDRRNVRHFGRIARILATACCPR
jgi:hypothetical protein